jgi:hypothetical protein
VTYRLRNLGQNETISKETLSIKVVEDFINSLKRVETQDLEIGRRYYEAVKLVGFSRYDYELESIRKFHLILRFAS